MDWLERTQVRQYLHRSLAIVSVASLCTILSGGLAVAQDQRLGFKVGTKSKMHLNLDLSAAMDTNPERQDTDSVPDTENFRIIVRPSVAVVIPSRAYNFRMRVGLTVSQFFPPGNSSEPSETKTGVDGMLRLRIGTKRSSVNFTIENTPILTPTILPELGTIGADEVLFESFSDTGRMFFTFRPGGGALEFDVGYQNQFNVFIRGSNTDGLSASPDDGLWHRGFIEGRLKFLPKTAALIYAEVGAYDVYNPENPNGITTPESNPISILLGVEGQITRSISAEVRLGYAESLVWAGGRFTELASQNQRTPVAIASVLWNPMPTVQVSAGYQRTLQVTTALGSSVSDGFRFRATWGIDRLQLGAYAEAQFRRFGDQAIDVNQNPNELTQNKPTATLAFGGLRADYYFFDWLIGGINYRTIFQQSNDSNRGNIVPELGAFARHQIFGTVGIRY